ncbi:hypothetical protein LTR17_024762 [Elasticomyces elasticus]|nr:hypothetical protein LTR17_024762 [Elasticomyces elasticus]
MAHSQGQSRQAATSDAQPQHQQQTARIDQSQSQGVTEEQAATTEPSTQREDVSVWAIGGQLEVDVGQGQRVPVPNTFARPPTREEIYQALVAAGHRERADELADGAYAAMIDTT